MKTVATVSAPPPPPAPQPRFPALYRYGSDGPILLATSATEGVVLHGGKENYFKVGRTFMEAKCVLLPWDDGGRGGGWKRIETETTITFTP